MMRILIGVLALGMYVAASDTYAQEVPPVSSKIYSVSACRPAPVIDGKLDDAAWKKALKFPQFRRLGTDKPASVPTTAYLTFDQDNLYVGFDCPYPENERLKQSFTNRDDAFWDDDECVEFFVDPGSGCTYYHFGINPHGALIDLFNVSDSEGRPWDAPGARPAVHHDKGIWSAELAIPFKDLGERPDGIRLWHMNFARERRTHEADEELSSSSGEFRKGKAFHPVRFEGLGNNKGVEVLSIGGLTMDHNYTGGNVFSVIKPADSGPLRVFVWQVLDSEKTLLGEKESAGGDNAEIVQIPYMVSGAQGKAFIFEVKNKQGETLFNKQAKNPLYVDIPKEDMVTNIVEVFNSINHWPMSKIVKMNGANLGWGESYYLMAWVAMYEGTGDPKYLKTAMPRFDKVLQVRDDKTGFMDEKRNKIFPAWASTRYTKGVPYVWIVHAGMLTYPMARSAYLVRRDPKLQARYGAKADAHVKAIEETVHAFDGAWRNGPNKGEGYYYEDYLERELPLNMQNAMGRTLVALWLATGKPEYREKAEKLAWYFKNRLEEKAGRYVWEYRPGMEKKKVKKAEDMSHAAINVDFAFVCYRAGLVFTKEDMLKFTGTFKACINEQGGFTHRVDGQGEHTIRNATGRWGHLGFLDRDVRDMLQRLFARKDTKHNRTGLAYLVETDKKLMMDKAVVPNQTAP